VHGHLQVVLPAGDYRDDALLTTAANNALALNVTVPDGVEATGNPGEIPELAREAKATDQAGNLWLTGTVAHGPLSRCARAYISMTR
jgi:hypothetical protein